MRIPASAALLRRGDRGGTGGRAWTLGTSTS